MLIGGRVNVRTTSNFFQKAASDKAPIPPKRVAGPKGTRLVRELPAPYDGQLQTVPGLPPYNKSKGRESD